MNGPTFLIPRINVHRVPPRPAGIDNSDYLQSVQLLVNVKKAFGFGIERHACRVFERQRRGKARNPKEQA
jgi:hypothetical protein